MKKLILGLCPLLVVATTWKIGLLMGLIVLVTTLIATLIFGLIQRYLPPDSRRACHIIIVGTVIGLADLYLTMLFAEQRQQLGIYLPLATVSCLLLSVDALEKGLGKHWSSLIWAFIGGGYYLGLLGVVGGVREIFGRQTPLASSAPGGFLSFGLLLGVIAAVSRRVCGERTIAYLSRLDLRR